VSTLRECPAARVLEGYAAARSGRFVFLAPEGDGEREPANVILNWR
jgi:hypothetical protein